MSLTDIVFIVIPIVAAMLIACRSVQENCAENIIGRLYLWLQLR